ncbi:hypothetical protein F5B18DRAFT_649487 [Nemania serpens]|nr:hypothetical protein F5B18DRAFT_649487 [Nemania serpens]
MHVVIRHMVKRFPKGILYLDLWLFNKTVVVVASPLAAAQVEAVFLDKPRKICDTLEIINGGPSLMTVDANTWKQWRGLFNPVFAARYITGLAPAFAEGVAVFWTLLRDRAKNGGISQIYWTLFGTSFNPFRRYFSFRPLV